MGNETAPAGRFSQASSVLEQHRQLHAVLDQIGASLRSRPDVGELASWLSALATHLRDLQPQLEAHFRHEEEKGLFEEIEQAMPEAAELCSRLQGEHQSLVLQVEQLRVRVEAMGPGDEADLEGLAALVRALLAQLGLHEELEDDLLFRALEGGIAAQD